MATNETAPVKPAAPAAPKLVAKPIPPAAKPRQMQIRNLTSGIIQLEDGSAILPGKTVPVKGNTVTPFLQKLKDGKFIVLVF